MQPHSIVVQLLTAPQRHTHSLSGSRASETRLKLFTNNSLHGKFLLLHSHECQEVSPVILLDLIALKSVSSLAQDIRHLFPNPVYKFIMHLCGQVLQILIPELLEQMCFSDMLDQSIWKTNDGNISVARVLVLNLCQVFNLSLRKKDFSIFIVCSFYS